MIKKLLVLGAVIGVSLSAASSDLYGGALSQAKRRIEIQRSFEMMHPWVGLSALDYVGKLKKEGFACRMQYRNRTSFDESGDAQISSTTEPGVECLNERYSRSDCPVFRVGLKLRLPNPSLSLEDLKKKLSGTEIADAAFVCERNLNSQEQDALKAGVRDGIVVGI